MIRKMLLRNFPLSVVIIFGLFFLFYRLGDNALIEYDEGIYALVSKNILKTGDWVTLHWRLDLPWFDKGPLYLWLTAVSLKVFGLTALAVRFWSAGFGLLTVVGVYFLGKKLYDGKVGFISALILSSTTGFLYYSRLGMLDVPNAAFNTLSLLFLIWSLEKPKFLILASVALGLGFLNRGPLAFFGLLSFLIFFLLPRRQSEEDSFKRSLLSRKIVLLSLLTFILVVVPWHLIEWMRHGNNFWQVYLGHQMFLRFAQTIEGKAAPFFWYITVLKTHFRIWTLVLVPALFFWLWKIVKGDRRDILILIWAALTFTIFTLASSKLIWYILPVYPPLSLICGRFLSSLSARLRLTKVLLVIVFLTALFYNFKSWSKIQTPDFNRDLVKLLEYKNRVDPEVPLLDVSYGVSVASFYSVGPVSQIPKEEIFGLLDGKKYRYALVTRGDWETLKRSNLILEKNLREIFSSGDGVVLSRREN